jgi:DNA-binding NarL/FixJ family response regulator
MSQPPESEQTTVSVVLVDDHPIWRGGVRSLLGETEFVVVGEAASHGDALAVVEAEQPRLVLLDVRLEGRSGLETLAALKAAHPRVAVIILTSYDNPSFMARAVAHGAAGYLVKDIGRDAFLEALRAVARGDLLLSAADLTRSLRCVGELAGCVNDLIEPLTASEEAVLRLLTTGLSNKEMATVLFVAESTVKSHMEHILGKLGVSDRVQAAMWAVRKGLVPLDDRPRPGDPGPVGPRPSPKRA